jgi:hypothetical protein
MMDRKLIAVLRHIVSANFVKMLKSYSSESESEKDLAKWIEDSYSFDYWLANAPFKKWSLKKLKPNKLRYHHDSQDSNNMEYIRDASGPDDVPPIIVDHEFITVDGAHRLRVAQEDGWEYINTWVPDRSSRMTDKEIEYLDAGSDGEDIVNRLNKLIS